MADPAEHEELTLDVGPWRMTLFRIAIVQLWVVSVVALKDRPLPKRWVKNRCLTWQGSEDAMREKFEVQRRVLAEVVALHAMGLDK